MSSPDTVRDRLFPATDKVGFENYLKRLGYGCLMLTCYYIVGINNFQIRPKVYPLPENCKFPQYNYNYNNKGVLVFLHLERPAELRNYRENRALYGQMRKLYSFEHCKDPAFKDLSFCKDQAKFSATLADYFNRSGPNSLEDKEQWTPLGIVFFLTHVATTIGYGIRFGFLKIF